MLALRGPTARLLASTALISLLPRAAAILRDLLLAWTLGVSHELDAWLAVALLPVPAGIALGQALAGAAVPVFLEARHADVRRAVQVARAAMLSGAAIGVALALVIGGLVPPLVDDVARGFEPAQIATVHALLPLVAATIPLVALGQLWTALGNTGGRFAASAAWPALSPLLAALAIAAAPSGSILRWLAVATLLGAALEATLQAATAKRAQVPLGPGWPRGAASRALAKRALRQTFALLGANLVLAAGPILDQAVASGLPVGSLSAFQLGGRVSNGIAILAAVPLAQVLLARFAAHAAKPSHDEPPLAELGRSCTRWTLAALALGIVAALPLVLAAEASVRLIFERGAFEPASTPLVARVQVAMAPQLPLYLAQIVLTRALGAGGAGAGLLRVAVVNLALRAGLDLAGATLAGVVGLALATTLASIALLAQLALAVRAMVRVPAGASPPRGNRAR